MNRTSKLFWPVIVTPKDAVVKSNEITSRSQKLMLELGLIKSSNNGTFQILPLAQRALDKCIALVTKQMNAIDAQKISLPVLTSSGLWKKTGRLDQGVGEFYLVKDRHGKEHLLSPTHEEAVTSMLASTAPISYKQLPLRLYQIGPKFRDELKTRFGLMRAKEFIMKDLYTFDTNIEEAQKTYEQVSAAYLSFFKKLDVPFVKVVASTGIMGGSVSHEYHFVSRTGEDRIFQCEACNYSSNEEACGEIRKCPKCQSSIEESRGIEIGHTFLLQDKYSKPLGATFLQANGKPQNLSMGCYGIGISRLLAASLEVKSTENELRWPKLLAPFDVCIISAKEGSKEQSVSYSYEQELYNNLTKICDQDDIILDDRRHLTIGKRLMESKRMGYPIIVVIGSKVLQTPPMVELYIDGEGRDVELKEVLREVNAYVASKTQLMNEENADSDLNRILSYKQ